jgi:protein TonB
MSDASLADQLDDAIEMMIAEPNSAPPRVDFRMDDLLAIASELRLLPDPRFRAALKAELLEECALPVGGQPVRRSTPIQIHERQNPAYGEILPTLFGAGENTYPLRRGNLAISAAIHAAIIVVIAIGGLLMAKSQFQPDVNSVLLTELSYPTMPALNKGGGGGGGGNRDKLSDSKGSLPRFAREQETPPAIVVRNEQPKLVEEPTIVGLPTLASPTVDSGNPLSAILQPSNGAGFGGGIGTGHGGGIGAGDGAGFGLGYGGGAGGGVFHVGGGVSAPRPIYDPDPEYSDEARREKFQGSVVLWVVVGADGKPYDIRVARTLGMGLDEKAIAAVRQWKFEPAILNGHPVAVQINVEVRFRLY